MKYRKYGKTDLKVSEICFGTMRYAPEKNNEQVKEAKRGLEEAIDLGINFIHSSYEYGTRWLTGEVLGQHPKRHELHHIVDVVDRRQSQPCDLFCLEEVTQVGAAEGAAGVASATLLYRTHILSVLGVANRNPAGRGQ